MNRRAFLSFLGIAPAALVSGPHVDADQLSDWRAQRGIGLWAIGPAGTARVRRALGIVRSIWGEAWVHEVGVAHYGVTSVWVSPDRDRARALRAADRAMEWNEL